MSKTSLGDDERQLYRDLFAEIDSDKNGKLSREELARDLFPKMGVKLPNDSMFDELFNDIDTNKDGTVSMDEFLVICERLSPTIRRTAEMRRAFKEMDCNMDGKITKEEFMKHLEKTGMPLEKSRVDAIFEKADKDKNGTLSLNEFLDAYF